MAKTKFVLNGSGVRALLKSNEMQKVLLGKAEEIRARCGDGFETDTYVGKTRANASIRAVSKSAKKRNLKENTILKAVRG